MPSTVEKLVFPCVCFLLGLLALFSKEGFGIAACLVLFLMAFLYFASARFRLYVDAHNDSADPKDEFVVSRNEIMSGLKTMISNSGAVDAEQFGINSFRGKVEFSKCHDVPIALIPIRLEQPGRPNEDSINIGAGWAIAYFCPAEDTWKAMPFFHFDKQIVVDGFSASLSSILQLSLEALK